MERARASTATLLLVLAGGLILRYVWIGGGQAPADDSPATHPYNVMA